MAKTGSKSDSMKMSRDEEHVFRRLFYLLNYLTMLNISVFRPSSGHLSY